MDVVAIVALGSSVDEEAPLLAADVGLTVYEAGMMLRAAPPAIVLRSDDRARTLDLLAKLRGRRHDAVAFDLDAVVSSDTMFSPKTFRLADGDLVATANGEERRLALSDVFALVRANHLRQTEDVTTTTHTKISLTNAALSGGLKATKVTTSESKRVSEEREPVLYVFRSDAAPWLLRSALMRYDGLADRMRVSKTENFEVLIKLLRELAPSAPYDARLLAARPGATVISAATAKHTSTSSAAAIDILAHIVALSLGREARPYR